MCLMGTGLGLKAGLVITGDSLSVAVFPLVGSLGEGSDLPGFDLHWCWWFEGLVPMVIA